MRNLNLENRKIDENKLFEFGFRLEKISSYIFEKKIDGTDLKIIIKIEGERITSSVYDTLNREEYFLVDVESAEGEFVGKVRERYDELIKDFFKSCFDFYHEEQTSKIIQYIKEKYNSSLEFLWERTPRDGIWRNKENDKWFGILMHIQKNKLGFDSNEEVEIIDLRCDKEKIDDIVDDKKVFRGYHMNKKSWITIILDGSVSTSEIYKLIDLSFELSKKK